jgi:hypothetical protein
MKSIWKYLAACLFAFALIFLIFAHSFAQFTEYENLKQAVSKIVKANIQSKLSYAEIAKMCEEHETVEIGIEDFGNISLPCNKIKEMDKEKFLSFLADTIFDKIYSKTYTCNFFKCLSEQPLVIISSYANSYFKSLEIPATILTALFGSIYFFLESPNFRRFKGLGYILLLSSFQFFLLYCIKDFFLRQEILEISNALFSSMIFYYILALVFGIVLFCIGYMLERKVKGLIREK